MTKITALFAVLVLLVGCAEDSSPVRSLPGEPASSEASLCSYDKECSSGEVCDWWGADPAQCITLDGRCDDGLCTSGYACDTSADCPPETHCRFDSGVCAFPSGGCSVDAECAHAQQICSIDEDGEGSCVACENSAYDPDCDCGAPPIERNGCLRCGC